ncbi:MAG TPA: HAD family phosphatase [Rectinemataceae bacterium]|nr:HAD family phosphatase [Rectinemataceae bacterium]
MLKAVLFDMDGVLVDSEAFIAEAACAMFAERHGIVVSPEEFRPFVGMGEDRYLGGVAELHEVKLDLAADKARTYQIYADVIRGRLKELPGAVAFVRRCRAEGLKTALVTSADAVKAEANLVELGLERGDFDAFVTGLDVERKKPYPDIYLHGARLIGVAPANCLVVEDAVSGAQAARAAGCACLGITSSFSEAELGAAGAAMFAPDLEHAAPLVFSAGRTLSAGKAKALDSAKKPRSRAAAAARGASKPSAKRGTSKKADNGSAK